MLSDLTDTGEARPESLALLRRADPDGYQLLMDGDRVQIYVPSSANAVGHLLEDPERARM